MDILEITPYKYVLSEIPHHKTFHYNLENFSSHLDAYDENHKDKKSLSNIFYS